jgi:pantoate kinase
MQADVERFLARLLTDPGLRERFLADRAQVAREAGLSPEEAQAVARMPSQDLRTAARSYQHKRDAKIPRRGRSWLAGWFGPSRP